MDPTATDHYRPFAEAYALGTLDGDERSAFEVHLESGCAVCTDAVDASASRLGDFARSVAAGQPEPWLRQQLMDLAEAPGLPVDPADYSWREIAPGIRVHLVREDPARNMRACLIWANPGVRHEVHRHGGDEVILVLKGGIRDERGEYGPGEICRSQTGSVHAEEALPGEDCLCYVVYYGDLEYL